METLNESLTGGNEPKSGLGKKKKELASSSFELTVSESVVTHFESLSQQLNVCFNAKEWVRSPAFNKKAAFESYFRFGERTNWQRKKDDQVDSFFQLKFDRKFNEAKNKVLSVNRNIFCI